MPEYLTPGVYIEEIERGPRPIEGVPTSTAAFLGETERGPTQPHLITSYGEYLRWFGGVLLSPGYYMPYSVSGFFQNGGLRLYVCRIASDTATRASKQFGGFQVQAIGPGKWGKRIWARIKKSTTTDPSGNPIGFRLQVAYWAGPTFQEFDPFDAANRNKVPRPAAVEDFDDLVFSDETSPDYYEKRLKDNSHLVELIKTGTDQDPTEDEGLLDQGGEDGTEVGLNDYGV